MSMQSAKQERAATIRANYRPRNKPFFLRWHGKDYAIAGVTSYYVEQDGVQPMHVFMVRSGADHFELRFTNEEVEWFLG